VNRRGFLGTLAAAVTGAVLDPELLLWKPGEKTFFLPSVQPVALLDEWYDASWEDADLDDYVPSARGNRIVTPDKVVRQIAEMMQNQSKFVANINRSYDEQFREATAGYTIHAKLPQRYQVGKPPQNDLDIRPLIYGPDRFWVQG
jgi:hypothetical protein